MAKLVNWPFFEATIRQKKFGLFSALEIRRLFGVSKVAATFLLHRYSKKKLIVQVRRGLYSLAGAVPPDLYIANKIYEPSYVSLETALSYHRVIPETVYAITSVTPKATRRFSSLGKAFIYRTIKRAAFTGYAVERLKGYGFLMADPEKAFVDSNYLRLREGRSPLLRFNRDKIRPSKALRYARLFGSPKLTDIVKNSMQ